MRQQSLYEHEANCTVTNAVNVVVVVVQKLTQIIEGLQYQTTSSHEGKMYVHSSHNIDIPHLMFSFFCSSYCFSFVGCRKLLILESRKPSQGRVRSTPGD